MDSSSYTCLPCSSKIPNCEKCDEFGQKCTKCFFHFELNPTTNLCEEIKGSLTKALPYFDDLDNTVNLVYDEQIKMEDLTKLSFQLLKTPKISKTRRNLAQSPGTKLNIKNIKIPKGEKRITAEVELPKEKFSGASIIVETTDLKAVRSKRSKDPLAFDSAFPVEVKDVNQHSTSMFERNLFKIVGYFLVITLFVVSLVMLAFSLPMMLVLTQFIQMVDNIKLLRQELPISTRAMIRPFRRSFIGSLFSPLRLSEGVTRCGLFNVFLRREMTCLMFNANTSIAILFVTIVLLSIKLLLELIERSLKPKEKKEEKDKKLFKYQQKEKKPSCFKRFFTKTNRFLSARFFFYLALTFQVDILSASFVAIDYGDSSSTGKNFDYATSIILVLIYIVLFFFSMSEAYQAYKLKRRPFRKNIIKPNTINPQTYRVSNNMRNSAQRTSERPASRNRILSRKKFRIIAPSGLRFQNRTNRVAPAARQNQEGLDLPRQQGQQAPPQNQQGRGVAQNQDGDGWDLPNEQPQTTVQNLLSQGPQQGPQDQAAVQNPQREETTNQGQQGGEKNSKQPTKKEEEEKRLFQEVFENDFNDEKPVAVFFLPFIMLISFGISSVSVLVNDYLVQILEFFGLFFILIIFTAVYKPYKEIKPVDPKERAKKKSTKIEEEENTKINSISSRVNKLYIIMGSFFTSIFVLLLIPRMIEGGSVSVLSKNSYKNFGYLITLLLLLPWVILLFTSIKSIFVRRRDRLSDKEFEAWMKERGKEHGWKNPPHHLPPIQEGNNVIKFSDLKTLSQAHVQPRL